MKSQTLSARLSEFRRKYLPKYIEEVGYIEATSIDPYKEKPVKAWVDQRFTSIMWLLHELKVFMNCLTAT